MEIWKDIPNYEGIYEASSEGRIRTSEGKTTSNSLHPIRIWESRIMKGRGAAKSGYRVTLWKDGKSKDFLVHRLIALTFLGNPSMEDATVNHIDGNRFNNKIENLEWLSRRDNIRYGFEHEQYSFCKPIRLIANDGSVSEFRSMSEASAYIGKNTGYISGRLKKGKAIKGYEVQIKEV